MLGRVTSFKGINTFQLLAVTLLVIGMFFKEVGNQNLEFAFMIPGAFGSTGYLLYDVLRKIYIRDGYEGLVSSLIMVLILLGITGGLLVAYDPAIGFAVTFASVFLLVIFPRVFPRPLDSVSREHPPGSFLN